MDDGVDGGKRRVVAAIAGGHIFADCLVVCDTDYSTASASLRCTSSTMASALSERQQDDLCVCLLFSIVNSDWPHANAFQTQGYARLLTQCGVYENV